MNRSIFALATACLLAFPSFTSADMIVQTNVEDLGSGAYWYSATDIVDAATSETALGGTGQLFCFDPYTEAPDGDGELESYTVGQNIFYNEGAWSRGQDLLNWLFNEYYADYFDPMEDFQKTSGFQFVLWKLAAEFDGTNLDSLNFTTGSIVDDNAAVDSADALLAALQTADIAEGYRSSLYTIEFLANEGHASQSMIFLAPAAVPEPSSLVLGLAGLSGVALIARRRRVCG